MLHSLFLIGSFGTTEILLILFVVILLFGAKRIPELFKGMGQGVREFKDATKENEAGYNAPPVPPAGQQYPAQGYQQPQYPQQPNPNYPPQGYSQQPASQHPYNAPASPSQGQPLA